MNIITYNRILYRLWIHGVAKRKLNKSYQQYLQILTEPAYLQLTQILLRKFTELTARKQLQMEPGVICGISMD